MKQYLFKLIQFFSFGRIFWKKSEHIYLTFDDGPHPENTQVLLDILKKYNAKATFFLIGENAKKYPDLVKKLQQEGHTIANHTYSHLKFDGDLTTFMNDINACEDEIKLYNTFKYFRIPYGVINLKLLTTLFFKKYKTVFWNKDTKDFELNSPDQVKEHIDIASVQKGDIILMHDFPAVTPVILEKLLSLHPDKTFSALK